MTVDHTTEYARAVVNGKKKPVCKAELAACRRHLKDLKRKDLEFRVEEAEKHIEFAGMLTYYDKNAKERKKVTLYGFEQFIIGCIFGWYKDGVRRFSEAYIQVGRKNGKTFLSGLFCVDFALLGDVKRAQIYTAGTNYDNARMTYNAVVEFIESDPELEELFKIQSYKHTITAIDSKTTIRALSGDVKKDGFEPLLGIVDEYHLHNTDEMYNVLLDGQVGLNNSLIVTITTAGFNLNSPCYKQYKYAKNIAAGRSRDDSLFVYIAEPDLPDAHIQSEAYETALWDKNEWAKSNPLLLYDNLGLTITKDPVRWGKFEAAGNKARSEGGSTLRDFITKKLDVWTTVGSAMYVSDTDWTACGTGKSIEQFAGKRCFLGLDLSSKNDLTSWSLTFPPQNGVTIPYLWSMSYLPKATLEAHIRKDKAPYDYWYKIGWLKLTDCGGTNAYILDYKFFLQDIKDYIKKYDLNILMIGYDPMGISAVLADLEEICPECVEIGQYPKSLNDTVRNFRDTVRGHGLEYDMSNELLTWSIMNAEVVENSKHELIIDKKLRRERIDPIDACLNSWKCALTQADLQAKQQQQQDSLRAWLDYMKKI